MSEYDYREANKLAIKEFKKATARKESPYPVGLDTVISPEQLLAGRNLGLEQIPLALVVGTKHEGRNNAFARNFMPLLDHSSEFAAKWKILCAAHLAEGIREPVKLYEYRNRFYVEEGNKRVSVLKYFDADSIDAYVIRIPSEQDGSAEAELYEAFLQFHECSGLRTVEVSEPSSYDKLQLLVGKKLGERWTEEERSDFLSFYYYYHKGYGSAGKKLTLRQLCDDMLAFMETHGYSCVKSLRFTQLKELIRQPVRKSMKILAVADDESKQYYEYYSPGKLDDFDLILACGDLHKVYLEFLTTMAPCPVLYVRGNHDDHLMEDPPGGCICIEDTVYEYQGLRIAGLGGSFRYRDGKNMFSEEQMEKRAKKLEKAIKKHDGVDILVTHAPARGVNDFDSLTHRGFETFNRFIEKHHPAYLVHGHIHQNYGVHIPQISEWNGTTIINAYEHCVFYIGGATNDTDHNAG